MKYIIDIPDEYQRQNVYVDGHGNISFAINMQCNGRNHAVPTNFGMTPYTEPGTKTIEDAQEEAWEFAQSIFYPEEMGGIPDENFKKCFYGKSAEAVLKDMSYQEAKAKYEAWKTEKESKIEVGDEVMHKITKSIGIATWVDPEANYVHIVWSDGSTENRKMDSLEKTGRHFNQVADMLKEMKEEE